MDPVTLSSLAYFLCSVIGVNSVLGMCPVSIKPSIECVETCVEAGDRDN